MNNRIMYTVLMPCLNEEKTVGICLKKAKKYMTEHGYSFELLVVDNGSTDSSVKVAKTVGARVIHETKKGYGNALIRGIYAAHGKYIIMADSDDSYDFSDMDNIVKGLKKNQLVVGNRYWGGIDQYAMPFTHKYIGVPVLSTIGKWKYGVQLSDFHCGMRGFDTKIARELHFKCGGMEFATELIAGSARGGYKIGEVPIKLHKDGRNGPSHLRSIRDGLRHMKFMIFDK